MRNRVAVVETVYFQAHGEQPLPPIESRYYRWLNSEEQPYNRNLKLTETWTRLDMGWLGDAGLLVIHNVPERLQTQPTDKERLAMANKVIELTYDTANPEWVILPGESLRAHPTRAKDLFIRCRSGECRAYINVIPS